MGSVTDASVLQVGVQQLGCVEQHTHPQLHPRSRAFGSSSSSSVTEISIELAVTTSTSSPSEIKNKRLSQSVISTSTSNTKNSNSFDTKLPDSSSATSLLTLQSDKVFLDSHSRLPEELSFLSEPSESSGQSSSILNPFMDISAVHPVVKSFLVGSISGTCSTVIFQPLDLLKTRLQNPTPNLVGRSNGMFAVVGHIVRDEKLLGLWRGMTPSLTRCVPGVGLYFGSIHSLKIMFGIHSEPTALQSIALGATARSITGVTMIPFTVIKTRFESKVYHYGGIREAITVIYQREGIRGLTCGLVPTLLRDAPFSALYLMMYTWTKKTVPKEWIDSGSLSPYVRFSCGVFAGVGASLVTQPFDVVKTKMQLFPDKFHSVPPVIQYIYEKYGMAGYFKGLMPRMVRRTLIAAMSWTVYEQLMRNFGLK